MWAFYREVQAMTTTSIAVSLPKSSCFGWVSRQTPETTYRVLGAIYAGDSETVLLSIIGDQLDVVLKTIIDADGKAECNILQRSKREATVQIVTSDCIVLNAAKSSSLPIEFPFSIRDGTATLTLFGSRDRLSAFGQYLEDHQIPFDVEFVGQRSHADQLLTEKQQDLVLTAIQRGYYDTPRRCTLTELAEHVGIAKSTCSETLQRAEGQLIKQFVEELPAETRLEILA